MKYKFNSKQKNTTEERQVMEKIVEAFDGTLSGYYRKIAFENYPDLSCR